jgi:hypothetical protein
LFTYGDSLLQTQLNPGNLKANNYGNADYDVRNNMSADFVYTPTVHTGHKFLDTIANGWQWSGKVFWRSGLPFSVTDNNWAVGNSSVPLLAIPVGGGGAAQTSCGSGAAVTPCLNANAFLNSGADSFNGYPSFSPQTLNQYRGPHFFNSDMALYRNFRLYERLTFAAGVQAFNVFNHPNFANPDSGLGDATFGQITGMLNSPTSPYGTFPGFDSSVRVVQITGKLTF